MIGYTYAQLVQSMQDWPVNQGTNYVGNIPRFVELGELRLVKDLNLEIFDVTNNTLSIAAAANLINKPAGLLVLRTMRLASITGTSSQAANTTALCASQATFATVTNLTFNGTLGASPATIAIPAQVTVKDTTSGGTAGGIIVTVGGLDYLGNTRTETIISVAGGTTTGTILWKTIITLTCSDGSTAQTISVGTAATAQNTLGASFPLFKRAWDYVNNYASNPAITLPPRYYAERDSNTWQIAQAADQAYGIELRYLQRPQTIVTAGTSWLGANCGELLLLTSLMAAEFYLKADDRFADLEGDYQTQLAISRQELRNQIRTGDYSPEKPAAMPTQG